MNQRLRALYYGALFGSTVHTFFPFLASFNHHQTGCLANSSSAGTFQADKVYPQASDDAINPETISLWGLFLSILAYVTYAVYKDLTHEWPTVAEMRAARLAQADIMRISPNDVVRPNDTIDSDADTEPQAELGPMEKASDNATAENVTFNDAHPGYKQGVSSYMDEVRLAALNDDATLDGFFSRPIRIRSLEWAVAADPGGLLYLRFNPWQDYFENLRVINRISNYKLLSAKLHVKFTINGNAFHYGRAICSYNPLSGFDTMTVDRAFIENDVVAASQRPHVYLDPTNSQGGELCLPFFTPRNLLDVTSMDWREMGEIVIHSMQGLKHANGATDTVTINVFAWAEDVRFAVPTSVEPGAIAPQAMDGSMDEYGKKPVSRIAGAVANMAARLVDAPWIGPYARATELGASAIGNIATIFGFSSPANIEMSQFRPLAFTNYAVSNMPSDAQKTSVDAKQELCIDPRTVGLDNVDELDLNYIAKKESWFTNFTWAIGAAPESLLFNVVVDPGVHNNFGDEIHMPACCFAVQPFKYWRGTMRYRFQVVCSKYHKGRLKLVYDPSGNATGTAEYNTAYTTIVDISDTSDFSIDVGWGQREPYRQHWFITTSNGTMFNTTPLTYASPISPVGNGTLAVYVVNELTVPNSTINNDIEINVFVSALDDFEVASPDFESIEKLRFTTETQTIAPQAQEGSMTEEKLKTESEPQSLVSLNTMANQIPSTADPTNLIYFGEKIKSFRQLLKRFSRHRPIPGVEGGWFDISLIEHTFPDQPGYTASPAINRNIFPAGASNYLYGYNNWINYVTSAYGGWRGGIRVMLDCSEYVANNAGGTLVATLYRDPDGSGMSYVAESRPALNTWIGPAFAAHINDTSAGSFADGAVLQDLSVNSLICAELPYQTPYRFAPAKRLSLPAASDVFDTSYHFYIKGNVPGSNRAYIHKHVAAAEDFTCFFFLGAPIMYLEPVAPGGV